MADKDIDVFREAALRNPSWNWYAIADSAQQRALPGALLEGGGEVRCLLGASQDSPLAHKSPHLVRLDKPTAAHAAWSWIGLYASARPCVTVIASPLDFDALFVRLAQCTDVILPDGDAMFFAFWDPVILGTLVGQPDDTTLHVPGPVLSPEQCATLTDGIGAWWYWDRSATLRSLAISGSQSGEVPLRLDQRQVDDLVEASVPDHVLYYLELNQGQLLRDIPDRERYAYVREALVWGRDLHLSKMNDLVNFVCVRLIYKERMQEDQTVRAILARVKSGETSFATALDELP